VSQLELFEERAAIMEYDGGLSRVEAEHEASKDVAKVAARQREPCYEKPGDLMKHVVGDSEKWGPSVECPVELSTC